MKIALYGGTFDPIHIAHLIIAEQSVEQLELDNVIFMPSSIPPHKKSSQITPANARLEMVRLAIAGNSRFIASEYEIEKAGVSYTVDTLQYLAEHYGLDRSQLYLIIGKDNYNDFFKWREPERILELCTIAVAGRPGLDESPKDHFGFVFLETPLMDISATDIRNRASQGKTISYLVPEPVNGYIRKNKLYR